MGVGRRHFESILYTPDETDSQDYPPMNSKNLRYPGWTSRGERQFLQLFQ